MSEPILQLLVLAGVVAVVAVLAWVGARRRIANPLEAVRPDLSPGVHFFSSSTCSACLPARAALTKVIGTDFIEVRFEDDPSGFSRWAIGTVPTVIVVRESGQAVVFEGVPRKRDLRRVVGGKWDVRRET